MARVDFGELGDASDRRRVHVRPMEKRRLGFYLLGTGRGFSPRGVVSLGVGGLTLGATLVVVVVVAVSLVASHLDFCPAGGSEIVRLVSF